MFDDFSWIVDVMFERIQALTLRPHANKPTSQQTKPPSEQATWVRFGVEDDPRTHVHGFSTLEGFGFNPPMISYDFGMNYQ